MGVLDFLFGKKEEEDPSVKINSSLKSSFLNVKKDILDLHKNFSNHHNNHYQKFDQIDQRLKRIESSMEILSDYVREYKSNVKIQRATQNVEEKDEEEITLDEPDEDNQVMSVLKSLPRAELKLFRTLYELQNSLNAKHISYKSLAQYLYPGKDYNSIRSTITQFVLRLYSEGLIDKQRIGKETYVKITNNGYKLLKNAKIKKLMKEAELTND
jgi:hypothetical protein